MAKTTLIRNEQPHEVKLSGKSKVAQSRKSHAAALKAPPVTEPVVTEEVAPIPKRLRAAKSTAKSAGQADKKTAGATKTPPARAPRRSSAKRAAPAVQSALPDTPRLPAHVPADGLWEADSAVMQRLNALVERNARLSEQIQRLQQGAPLKGFQP